MSLYLLSSCGCDEPDEISHPINDSVFPSSDQIWGMIGTILTSIAFWMFYHYQDKNKQKKISRVSTSE